MINNQVFPFRKDGVFTALHYFDLDVGGGQVERFEWKRSTGPEVQAMQGRSHGMYIPIFLSRHTMLTGL
jgi:hypothetical protein